MHVKQVLSLTVNQVDLSPLPPTKIKTSHRQHRMVEKLGGDREFIYPFPIILDFYKVQIFSNNNVRLFSEFPTPQPVHNLFPITSEFTLSEAVVTHIYVCGVFVKQVIFLTVNHRGPLPLRELHSCLLYTSDAADER